MKCINAGNETSPFYGLECNKTTLDELALLFRLRVTNNFEDTYQFLLPLDKKHVWRTELIDATFEVADALVGNLVPGEFLGAVREFFVYLSEKNSWSLGLGWPEEKPNKEVLIALHLTKECLKKAAKWDLLSTLRSAVSTLVNAGYIVQKDVIKNELIMKKGHDPIMEIVWLTINIVGESCHQILGFESDYWLDFMTVAADMYLKPMADFWQDSADEQKYYPLIFGGYNFTREYEVCAVFCTTVYDTVKYKEIWSRPEELVKGRASGNLAKALEADAKTTIAPAVDARRKKRQHLNRNRILL